MKKFFAMFVLAFALGSSSCNKTDDAEDRMEDSIEAQKDSIEDRAEQSKDSLDSLKNVYEARMDSADAYYTNAERQYNEAKGKEKIVYKRRLDTLGIRREALRSKWTDVKAATHDTWDKVRMEWDELWNDYDEEYRRDPNKK